MKREEELSIAAGRIIGELYDAFLQLYGDTTTEADIKNLNVLCVRIVFCLYAEDSGILPKNAFYNYLNKFISSDIRVAMRDFFETLNTKPENRDRFLDPDLARLPYVNGGLFGDNQGDEASGFVKGERKIPPSNEARGFVSLDIPPFSTAMRQLLLDKASLNFDWSAISPTIFGAVFESILNPDTRRKGGMHYTSVENIHKVNDPLFLDALWKEFGEIVGGESNSRKTAKTQRQGDEASPRIEPASRLPSVGGYGFVKRAKETKPPASYNKRINNSSSHEAGGFVSLFCRRLRFLGRAPLRAQP